MAKYKLAVLDFETDPFLHGRIPYPFAAGLYDGNEYIEFWGDDCAEDIAEYIKTRKLKVYAHNGGKFDFFYLLRHLDKEMKIINGRIAKCKLGKSTLLDSYLILPIPLAAMQKDEIDYAIFEREEREKPENKEKIRAYLKTDCEYLYKWVSMFIDRFGDKLTLAGAAFDQLEACGYDPKARSFESYDEKFRGYYYGGRCQAIQKGYKKGNYKVYDINSAYPFAMLHRHPKGQRHSTVKNPKKLPKPPYFATITAISKGALPIREKTGLTFYNDDIEREYKVTGWEIEAGLETGTLKIINILEVTKHNENETLERYVHKFYKEKLEGKRKGDKALETFAKLMLNSAYGKFGQDGEKFKSYRMIPQGEIPLDHDELSEKPKDISLGDYLQSLEWEYLGDNDFGFSFWSRPDPDDKYYNVAIAASITGFVRAMLWRSIRKAVDPIYCDTDSLICKSFGGELGDNLGQWKLEGETFEGVYIAGKKLYTLKCTDGKVKKASKGARLTHDEIKSMILTRSAVEWKNHAPSFSLYRPVNFVSRILNKNVDNKTAK